MNEFLGSQTLCRMPLYMLTEQHFRTEQNCYSVLQKNTRRLNDNTGTLYSTMYSNMHGTF